MAVLACFIGIDRFLDPKVRELTGARRDALGLWSLFTDTLAGARTGLLVDADATVARIRQAFDETLEAAGPDDTVIISFAGHGSHDHRLVVHDTMATDVPGTTIPMAELAERFRRTKARAVLLILDCCFSGGAPARVFEESPMPRDPVTPLAELAGSGRILIAACADDEYALEDPKTRHGLLTAAVMEALQGGEGTVQLATASDQIMSRVRTEALRMGYAQTPVTLGYIEGGLTLPTLRPGVEYFRAFPERRGLRVSGAIEELSGFGLPSSLLYEWGQQFPGGLNSLQLAAVNEHRVLDGQSLLVVAPTSSGKTFLGEMAAARAVTEGRRAVFLFPYKALVNEKFDQFTRLYGERLGMRVVRCTGDYQDQTGAFIRGKYDIATLTYEMFLNLSLGNPAVLNQVGLVVVDEAQFITDPGRGITVELLLTNLLAARERGIAPQVIALSAVIGELNEFDNWLGSGRLVTEHRPVPLVEGVLDRTGVFQSLGGDGRPRTEQLLPRHAIVQRKEKPGAQDIIVPLVGQLLAGNAAERVIVFRNQRGPAEGCAAYLAADLGLPSADAVLAALPERDLSSASQTLRRCLQGGTAFHNTNLSREEREVVERAFRDPSGRVRVLGATTTVAAGINTPADTVIIAEQEFIGDDGRPFTVAEYKNMAGRAGRLGYKQEGRSIILAETPTERQNLFVRFVLGTPEGLRSSFDPKQLETWVLRLLAQVRSVPRAEVVRLLANTYGGYLASRRDPDWRVRTEERLLNVLDLMVGHALVEKTDDRSVRLTLLGQACGRSSLAFGSVLRLVRLLRARAGQRLTAEHLMVLVQALPEADATYTPLMKKGQFESRWPREVASRFGHPLATALQEQAEDQFGYYARCKRAMVLSAWTAGVPLSAIEREHTANPFQGRIGSGDVRRFTEATRFHLRSAYDIATLLLVENGPADDEVEVLLKCLETGVPAELHELLDAGFSLGRGECLALRSVGIRTASELVGAERSILEHALGIERAKAILGGRTR
jgi:helicase